MQFGRTALSLLKMPSLHLIPSRLVDGKLPAQDRLILGYLAVIAFRRWRLARGADGR